MASSGLCGMVPIRQCQYTAARRWLCVVASGCNLAMAPAVHGSQSAAGQRFCLLSVAPGRVIAHAGRRRPAGAPGPARPEQGPGQGTGIKTVQDHPDRLLVRRPVPASERIPRGTQPGQVGLVGPPDPLPDRGEPVIPGRSERADRDRDQAGQRVDPPRRERGSGSASRRCHVPAARSSPSGPDSTTRAPTRDNATASTPHLVHVDLRDLHDHRGVSVLTTVPFRPTTVHARQTPVSPEHAGALTRRIDVRNGSWNEPGF
jgi:hypothetical protein